MSGYTLNIKKTLKADHQQVFKAGGSSAFLTALQIHSKTKALKTQSCGGPLTCFIIDRTFIHNASAASCIWMKHKKKRKISLSRLKVKEVVLLASS